jgi:hypothetical protein
MDERLVDRRDIRRRVLQRDAQLRRQGRGAICVVNPSGAAVPSEMVKQRHDMMTLGMNYKFD